MILFLGIHFLFSFCCADVGEFIVFSDVHYDSDYGTPSAYGQAACSNGANKVSTLHCGTNKNLLTSVVASAAKESPNPDFILFTGDMTRHNNKNGEQAVKNAFGILEKLLEQYFPNKPAVALPPLDLGNNDFKYDYKLDITSLQPCFGPKPVATNLWLKELAHTFQSQFISCLESETFACGGYLSREIYPRLNVISLNSLAWSNQIETQFFTNELENDDFDPFGQHEWLRKELKDLRSAGKKAYIIGHIPPIVSSYYKGKGRPLLFDSHSRRYHATIEEFSDVISAQLFGHTHFNELRVSNTLPGNSPPILIIGAVSPVFGNNPGFSVIKYDRGDSMFPLDIATYYLNLNGKFNIGTNNIANFEPLFQSLLQFLDIKKLINSEVMSLAGRLVKDQTDESWKKYWQWYQNKGEDPPCNEYCRIKEACIVACGPFESTWADCVSNEIKYNPKAVCVL